MSLPREITRRDLFVKVGIFLNGIVAVILAVPIVRYLLSPVARERKSGYESWIPLGNLEQFPSGETRLATYRNPTVNTWDGVRYRVPDRRSEIESLIEPVTHLLDQAHDGLPTVIFVRLAVGEPVVGISPASMSRFPCSSL